MILKEAETKLAGPDTAVRRTYLAGRLGVRVKVNITHNCIRVHSVSYQFKWLACFFMNPAIPCRQISASSNTT